MKKTEKKVRNEISEFILRHIGQGDWEGYLGEVFIKILRGGKRMIICCGCYDTIYLSLIVDDEKVEKFKAEQVRKGLTQLRWLLEKLKR